MGELGKLGIKVAKSTVDKYRVRSGKAPSPTRKSFLTNHINDLVSIDFLIVPTIRFKPKFFASTPLRIRPLCGRRSRSLKLFRGRPQPSICYEIVMRSTEEHFKSGFAPSVLSKPSVRREVLGKIHLSNASLAHYDATAATTLSF